ncbi:TonB family protein [Primorskyibacter sp. S187A]|uniref:energy transducer TonB family protein n=1 Tax=Primorskyibacter sp. S187A TaxID=3415130 RepID=UPI003C7B9395
MLKVSALALAVALHGAVAYGLYDAPQVLVEDQDGSSDVKLGNSFADMAIGTLEAVDTTSDITEPVSAEAAVTPPPPEPAQPHALAQVAAKAPEALPAQPSKPAETPAASTPPRAATSVRDTTPTAQAALADLPALALRPDTQRPVVAPQEAPATLEALAPRPAPPPKPTQVPKPAAPSSSQIQLAPPKPLELSPAAPAPAQVVTAIDNPDETPMRSKRPQPRSKSFEQRHASKTAPPQTQARTQAAKRTAPAKPAARGNAKRNAKAGTQTGRTAAVAPRKGTAGRTGKTEGNAAVSNYPGKVFSCVRRSAGRITQKGSAVISFSVSGSGRISGASVSRSSGSSRFDRAALRAIQRAGPCPAPPSGAQRSFRIPVKIR